MILTFWTSCVLLKSLLKPLWCWSIIFISFYAIHFLFTWDWNILFQKHVKICINYARQTSNCYLTALSSQLCMHRILLTKAILFHSGSKLKAQQLQGYLHRSFATNSAAGGYSSMESDFLLTLDYKLNFFYLILRQSWTMGTAMLSKYDGMNLGKYLLHS